MTSTLWHQFTDQLKESGYTLSDLAYCSDDLFLSLAKEMGSFTPLQISGLVKEWHQWMPTSPRVKSPPRRQRSTSATGGGLSPEQRLSPSSEDGRYTTRNGLAGATVTSPSNISMSIGGASAPATNTAGATAAAAMSTSPSRSTLSVALREHSFAPPRRSAAKVKEEAEYLLGMIGAQSGEEYQVSPVDGMVAVEAAPEAWGPFFERTAALHVGGSGNDNNSSSGGPQAAPKLLWKLCSPVTLSKMERACVSGSPFGMSNQDDTDPLCASAVVLYAKEAARLTHDAAIFGQLCASGWALVAFDVAVGKTRTVTKEEAQDLSSNLLRFSMLQCLGMLSDAGFDSFYIPSRNAVAVCHMHQLMPRFVVYVSTISSVTTRRMGDGRKKEAGTVLPNSTATLRRPEKVAGHVVHGSTPPQPVSNVSSEDDLKCPIHPTKTVEFWSSLEKRLLCSHCLYYDGYTRENCVPIEQAAREETPRLERWTQNAATFAQEVRGVFDVLTSATADVNQADEHLQNDIHQGFNRLRAKLDAMEADLVHQSQFKSQQNRQALSDSQTRVAATVGYVAEVVQEAERPLKAYRGGALDMATCVSLLRCTQRAFGAWEVVPIPSYQNVVPLDGFLHAVEVALKAVPTITVTAGRIQLPEAVDVNYLKADCE